MCRTGRGRSLHASDGDDRLIAALLGDGQAWDLVGPHGQAIQRDDEGRKVVMLMASKEDAAAIAREWYVGDEPRARELGDVLLLLESLASEDALVDAGAHVVGGSLGSWRIAAQHLLGNLLEAIERAGRQVDGYWQPEDVEGVQRLDTAERYEWFLKWVAADEAAWALGDDTSFMTFPYEDGQGLVLWPHAAFARRWAKENDVTDLELHRLPWPRLLSELEIADEAGELVAVFPGADERSTVLYPDDLRAQLEGARVKLRADGDA